MFLSLMTARQGWEHLPLPASAALSPPTPGWLNPLDCEDYNLFP